MSFILDLIIIAIIFFSAFIGYKKGFIKSVVNLVAFFVALILAINLTQTFANFLSDKFLFASISSIVASSLSGVLTGATETAGFEKLFETRPEVFENILGRFGMSIDSLEQYYRDVVLPGGKNITEAVAEYIAKPIAATVSAVLAFILIFVLTVIAVKLICLILNLIFKLPLLNGVNKIFGLVIGAISGILYAWLLSRIFNMVAPALATLYPTVFSKNLIDKTALVNIFSSIGSFTIPGVTAIFEFTK